ncbi:methyl-accepting chemotaxis protein, partial [Pseudomonas sp. FW305-3-2-15-E-TSA4]|nr:methyl-accepting chemotaxis protein [Pseudomonas sp. FW305-3-2-15-E-TSA4]
VGSIAGATGRLARGDTHIDLKALDRKDELGAIVDALTVFRDASFEKARLQEESELARRTAADDRARNDARQAEAAAQQALVVQSIANGLE